VSQLSKEYKEVSENEFFVARHMKAMEN